MSNGDADDPSLEEISAFLDGETVTGLTSEKLESLSESNPELYQKVAEMHSVKLTLDNFLSAKNLTVTNEIKEKVLSLVKDKVSLDDDELIDEDELLVSSYVDGEVSAEEAIEAEKLIAESDYYRSIYEAHSDAKNKVASLIKQKKPKSQLLPNRFVERFLPLAAVFVFGAFISPFILNQNFLGNNNPGMTLRGTSTITEDNTVNKYRGMVYQNFSDTIGDNSTEKTDKLSSLDPVSIYLIETQSVLMPGQLLAPKKNFQFVFSPPYSGEGKIFINVSKNEFPSPLSIGEEYLLGQIKKGELTTFPVSQELNVDIEDKQMRIDFELENGSQRSVFTQYIRIGKN